MIFILTYADKIQLLLAFNIFKPYLLFIENCQMNKICILKKKLDLQQDIKLNMSLKMIFFPMIHGIDS